VLGLCVCHLFDFCVAKDRACPERPRIGSAGDHVLQTIYRGCYWLLACEVVIMALLIAFPQISLFLPNLMS
jgi:TRAP-type mannitol/chloroaromatic compound transport system permease large subunit